MPTLDPRSLIAMSGFMALIMSVVLVFMRRNYPPSFHGLGQWALAPLMWMASAALFTAPGLLPTEMERFVANALFLGGFLVFHVGCRLFVGRSAKWHRGVLLLAVALLALAWFSLGDPSYRSRVVIVTLTVAVMQMATLFILWRAGHRSFPTRLVQFTLLVHLAVMAMRIREVWADPQIVDLLAPASGQIVYLSVNVALVLLFTLGSVLMATDRVRSELEHTATHDSLTGVLNRGAILLRCTEEHERCRRYGQPFVLMMLDLDHFKAINDRYGHQHGDKVLVHFAKRTQAALRRPDQLGRYGGEEFLILLPATAIKGALLVAARIHEVLSSGDPLDCQVSIGATACLGNGDSLDAMLARADAALYRAKDAGRGQTCVG